MEFNINTHEVVEITNKLEKLHKSAMPIAVRETLNEAAVMGRLEMIKQFKEKDEFTIRKPNFINVHSKFNKSKNTFDINQMQSEFGLIKGKSNAGDELEKVEFGGIAQKRDFIPMDEARGGTKKRLILKKHYLQNIKPKKGKSIYKSQQLIRAAIKTGKGGYVLYGHVLSEIKKIEKPSRNKIFIKYSPIYHFKDNRSVKVQKNAFIEPAGQIALDKIPQIFKEKAQKRFDKYLK